MAARVLFRKTSVRFIIFLVLIILFISFVFFKRTMLQQKLPNHIHATKAEFGVSKWNLGYRTPRRKVILFWTTFYGSLDYYWGFGHEAFTKMCPGKAAQNCETTSDKNLLGSADAVVIFMREFKMPPVRHPDQHWVFFNVEPPPYSFMSQSDSLKISGPQGLKKLKNMFNLTMSYRLDSDAVRTYGYMAPVEHPRSLSARNYATGKDKFVAWFVSHCSTSSHRMKYVEEVSQHIPVDIFGACSESKCPRFSKNCDEMVNQHYKFVFALENSICKDYVSEKVFEVLKLDTVPIVLGGAEYDQIVPKHSIINVRDFTSPKALADYLKVLDNNDTLYNEYFAWKGKFEFHHRPGFCELCEKLNDMELSRKNYDDIYKWYISDAKCERWNSEGRKWSIAGDLT